MAQLTKLLESGSRLNSAVQDGLSLQSLGTLYPDFNGAVSLAVANWPQSIPKRTKAKIEDAAKSWSFAQKAWAFKIKCKSYGEGFSTSIMPIPEPLKPLIKTSDGADYTGKAIKIAPWLAYQTALTAGSAYFEASRTEILKELNR